MEQPLLVGGRNKMRFTEEIRNYGLIEIHGKKQKKYNEIPGLHENYK